MPLWTPYVKGTSHPQSFLHIFKFSLDRDASDAMFHEYLAADEQMRFKRLLIPAKKNQFLRGRGVLRLLLSHYLKSEPAKIRIEKNIYDKPFLDKCSLSVFFNVSHSGQYALIAIASDEVGIDIERIKSDLDFPSIATRFFHATELAVLNSFATHRRRRAFYRLWTRKESLLKMLGCGFANCATNIPEGIFQKHFHVSSGYVAAVAMASVPDQVRYFDIGDEASFFS